MQGTIWAIIPPILAIVVALITKKVYFSLFLGVLSGALLYTNFSFFGEDGSFEYIINTISANVGDSYNFSILIFLVFLGMLVALMQVAGGTAAYGRWATTKIKSKRGALLSTAALGAIIFVDDYFNCLTVGTVMRPITDKFKITRAKLAYIIDATAAPVCIIAPISSWGAAVSSYTEGTGINGFSLMLSTIPANLYAILTLVMVVFLIVSKMDFGPMAKTKPISDDMVTVSDKEGRVSDLALPIIFLIVSCVFFMLMTGGIFNGTSIVDSFANCNAALSLAYGSIATIIFTFILYLTRKTITISQFGDCFMEGFKQMLPAIVILMFAWSLKAVCVDLALGDYVSNLVNEKTISFLLPILCFLVALGIAFATGTSWGTFGILIPIVCSINKDTMCAALILQVAAVLSGAVCGDHISPISDTTILASTGAQCNHVQHVSTQIPYAMIVCACCILGYLVAGLTNSVIWTLLTGVVSLVATLFVIWYVKKKKGTLDNEDASSDAIPE